jgi:thymidylate synthase (FAD)
LIQTNALVQAKKDYQWALNMGIAKEVARSILPEGLTMSTMYMKGSLRSWIHYCDLRMGNGTQKEHRLIAESCWQLLSEKFPTVFLEGN